MSTITHISGLVINIGSQRRQRCAWCGYVLEDVDLTRIAVQIPEDGSPPSVLPGWPVGALIEVYDDGAGGRAMAVVTPAPTDPEATIDLPENCCGKLPAELTLAVEPPRTP